MKLEISINGTPVVEGNEWILYERSDFRRLTNIFKELKKTIIDNKNEDFETLKLILKLAYENKKSRSE